MKAQLLASIPSHEIQARTKGVPTLGSGAVFPVDEDDIKVEAFALPSHWARIAAIDFGWDHPTAVVWYAWDRDTDTTYLYDCMRARKTAIPIHASAINGRGKWIPVAWPQDGYGSDGKRDGKPIRDLYAAESVRMLPEHATLPDGSNSVEAGVQEMLIAMLEGRFKVFSHLNDWFSEYRTYHRKEGKIVKEHDDLMDAGRYGYVSRRFARVQPNKDEDRPRRERSWKLA
ncbi:MAG: terminase [Burkholderiales bacterium]|nr:terminase [Burkholderiales bacterium]